MRWILDALDMMSVSFVPHYVEVDSENKPTGRFKGVVGHKYIEFQDLPIDLQNKIKEFVESVLIEQLGDIHG